MLTIDAVTIREHFVGIFEMIKKFNFKFYFRMMFSF